MIAALNINERRPILSTAEGGFSGIKTLFVRALKTWPAAIGQPEPCIPLDVVITVRNKIGSIYVEDSFPLPNAGYYGVFAGESIEVDAYYTPTQGLIVPFASYMIEAGVVEGYVEPVTSSFANKLFASPLPAVLWPAAPAFNPVPSYSQEFRVVSAFIGTITLFENEVGVGTQWQQPYDFSEVERWEPLGPFAVKWRTNINGYPHLLDPSSIIVEFR